MIAPRSTFLDEAVHGRDVEGFIDSGSGEQRPINFAPNQLAASILVAVPVSESPPTVADPLV